MIISPLIRRTDLLSHYTQALSSINIPCSRLLLPKNQDIGEFAKNSDDRQASLSALVQGAVSFNQSYENLIGKT